MKPDDLAHGFREAAGLLDLPENLLRYWAQAGVLTPSGQRGTRRYYTFADLIGLRAAHELGRLGVALPQVREALRDLTAAMPADPADQARLHVTWDGRHLSASAEAAAVAREPLFSATEIRARIEQVVSQPGDAPSAYDQFVLGLRLDEQPGGEARAEAAYRRAVELDPTLSSAWTNLGNLLHRGGDASGARRCYERALEVEAEQPEARYNLANLLDESGESEQAVAEYERALRATPDFADAHHNLALLLERLGAGERAERHLRRYRELTGES